MTGYIVRRILQSIIVVLGVMVFVYIIYHLEPAYVMARAIVGPRASAQQIQAVIQRNAFNKPFYVQFWREIDNYSHLNFGFSFQYNAPVLTLIQQNLPRTGLLVGVATVFALIVAIPLGVFQTVRRNRPSDYALTSLAFIFYSMPPYVLGPLLAIYLAIKVHIFDATVPSGLSVGQLATNWRAMTLPVLTLAAVTIAAFSRYMRSSMMDALAEDYVRTARAKGAGRGRVLFRHAFRNALIPIITLLGLSLPNIAGGAVLTETVFNYPGMGYLTTQAAERFDLGLVMGTTVVFAVLVVVGNLVADILYAVLDPRIRYAR